MKRPSSILVAAAALLVALVATATSGAAGSQTAGFRFGVILPTSATDLNWSQTFAAASRDVARQLRANLSMTDKVFDPTQARPLFNQLLARDTVPCAAGRTLNQQRLAHRSYAGSCATAPGAARRLELLL